MTIPFLDLTREVNALREEIDAAIRRVVDSAWFILGEETRAFEMEFANACGTGHAVGVASGTDAIELALRALEIGPGDEVITQANTCVPTVAAICRAGATPVLCDVELEAAVMDVESLAQVLSPRTRAIVPVHLYGQCADLDAISALARECDAAVVEDCAQAHGALFRGRHAGTVGVMGCFSFYPTKNLGALGDAGAVITEDNHLAERLRKLRTYGQTDVYRHEEQGVNSRLDELQAAILRAKLPHLDAWNARRAQIADVYSNAFQETDAEPLAVLADRRHVFHLFVVRVRNRGEFRSEMEHRGVKTLIHYPQPIHRQGPYAELGRGGVALSRSEELAEHIVSLPLSPQLTENEVTTVAEAAQESAGKP
jgi:dTDP-4-amino-4,6-dideoxygalactose transaminase